MRQELKDICFECLDKIGEATAKEIAGWIFKNKPDWFEERVERKKNYTLHSLFMGITIVMPQASYSEIFVINEDITPKTYRLKEDTDEPLKRNQNDTILKENADKTLKKSQDNKTREEDLYQPLCEYLQKLKVKAKIINANKTKGKKGKNLNLWRYPDVVGIQDLSKKWENLIIQTASEHLSKRHLLWSFEVKLTITSSNLREYFFQTVSNSSWAHLSYLVAELITEDAQEELRILCQHHGIGFILLDKEEPKNSQIEIHARERPQVDWASANKLCENTDFRDYIKEMVKLSK